MLYIFKISFLIKTYIFVFLQGEGWYCFPDLLKHHGQVGGRAPATLAVNRGLFLGAPQPVEGHLRQWPSWPSIISYPELCLKSAAPTGVKRVHINSVDVEGMVFQTFWNGKQRSCIQFNTNEQLKLISFICEGVDFTLGIRYVSLRLWVLMYYK